MDCIEIVQTISICDLLQRPDFNKTADVNWFVGYHQDRSIPVDDSASESLPGWSRKQGMTFIQPPDDVLGSMLALRLHLDDSSETNGPLRVIWGSHNSGTLSPKDSESFRASSPEYTLTVDRGGVIAMRPLLLHASSKSTTMRARRVLHFLFGPSRLPSELAWRIAI